jgi:restriction endonuclease
MIAILLFAAIGVIVLGFLLARYAPPIARGLRHGGAADRRPSMPVAALRSLTVQLLGALGLSVGEETETDVRNWMATKREPLGEVRYVVVLAPAPPGGVVDQAEVVSLAESVKGERAAGGVLITPDRIEAAGLAGLDAPIELVDGQRFRELVAQYLPHRLGELESYRGFGASMTSS